MVIIGVKSSLFSSQLIGLAAGISWRSWISLRRGRVKRPLLHSLKRPRVLRRDGLDLRAVGLPGFRRVPGPDPIKYFQRRVTLCSILSILIGWKWSHDTKQPIGMLKFQRSVNLGWKYFYRNGPWLFGNLDFYRPLRIFDYIKFLVKENWWKLLKKMSHHRTQIWLNLWRNQSEKVKV